MMYRSLSLFAGRHIPGRAAGNVVALVAAGVLHVVVVCALRLWKGLNTAEAMLAARFPKLTVQFVWAWTFSSSLFASLQLLSGGEGSAMDVGVAAAVLVLQCAVPAAALHAYVGSWLKAEYFTYDYAASNREESLVLLPVGHWEPAAVRRCVPFVSLRACETVWLLMLCGSRSSRVSIVRC